jgi:hypothetical protein
VQAGADRLRESLLELLMADEGGFNQQLGRMHAVTAKMVQELTAAARTEDSYLTESVLPYLQRHLGIDQASDKELSEFNKGYILVLRDPVHHIPCMHVGMHNCK